MYTKSSVKIIWSFFLLITAGIKINAQAPTHTRRFTPVLDANINGFYEYLPRNYAAETTTKYPLIVFFHGVGESGSTATNATLDKVLAWGPPKLIDNKIQNKVAPAVQFPDSFRIGGTGQWFKFIVISPQIKAGLDATTTDTIRPSTVDAVIEYAKSNYRVDINRIYLCGLSMGGGATWDYAGSNATAANKLAAIAVACGAGDLTVAEANVIASANLPVLATHNNGDPTVLISRTKANITNIKAYIPAIALVPQTVYWSTGTHNVWSRTYEDINPGVTTQSLSGNLRDTLGMNVYEWMLQFSRTNIALPVSWQNFTARETNGTVQLHWAITQQVNTFSYTVEKSKDGSGWSTLGSVHAQANAGNEQDYQYTDPAAWQGQTFYRIRQTDRDGTFSYSGIQKITIADKQIAVSIFPNPFQEKIVIHCKGIQGRNVLVKLVNSAGYVFLQEQHAVTGIDDDILSAG